WFLVPANKRLSQKCLFLLFSSSHSCSGPRASPRGRSPRGPVPHTLRPCARMLLEKIQNLAFCETAFRELGGILKRNEMRVLLDQAYATLDHAKCEAAAERALLVLASAPKEPESYLLMAEVAEENQRPEQALMWIDQGLAHHPQHIGLLVK